MGEWQPIETAPKDRTKAIVIDWLNDGEPFYDVAYFSEWNGDEYQPGWYSAADDSPSCSPTHWMPLPAPPIRPLPPPDKAQP